MGTQATIDQGALDSAAANGFFVQALSSGATQEQARTKFATYQGIKKARMNRYAKAAEAILGKASSLFAAAS